MKCLIVKAFCPASAQFWRNEEFGKWVNWEVCKSRNAGLRFRVCLRCRIRVGDFSFVDHSWIYALQFTHLPNYPITKSLLMLWPFITLASAAAASYAGYAAMSPASQLYGRTRTHGSDPNQMALTFDDGPNDPHTMHLLDVLAKHDAK